MYGNWVANATVIIVTLMAVSLSVLTHYEGLLFASRNLPNAGGPRHVKVLYAILTVLTLHVIEIWIFGTALWVLLQWQACGSIAGTAGSPGPLGILDSVYFSAMTYSTVGFGDVVPIGPIRLLAGTEGLLGLLLIGWSASFTYLEMKRFWRVR